MGVMILITEREKERVTLEVGKVTVRTHEEDNFLSRCIASRLSAHESSQTSLSPDNKPIKV